MKKFKCTVTRVDIYEIEIDENVYNEEHMKAFSSVFHPVTDLEDYAEDLAFNQARLQPYDGFFEGHGAVKINGRLRIPDKTKGNEAVNIKIISEDDDRECEIEEIEVKEVPPCSH